MNYTLCVKALVLFSGIYACSLSVQAQILARDAIVIVQSDQLNCTNPEFYIKQADNSEKLRQDILNSYKQPLKTVRDLNDSWIEGLYSVQVRLIPKTIAIFGVGNRNYRTEDVHFSGCIVLSASMLQEQSFSTPSEANESFSKGLISGATVAVNLKQIEKIQTHLNEILLQTCEPASQGPCQEVYGISISFFPLTSSERI